MSTQNTVLQKEIIFVGFQSFFLYDDIQLRKDTSFHVRVKSLLNSAQFENAVLQTNTFSEFLYF